MAKAAGPVIGDVIAIAGHDRAADRRDRPGQRWQLWLGLFGRRRWWRWWWRNRLGGMRDGSYRGSSLRFRCGRLWCGRLWCGHWRRRSSCRTRRCASDGRFSGWCRRRLSGALHFGAMLKPAVPAFGAAYRATINADGAVRDRIAGVARGARNDHGVSNHAGRIAARGLHRTLAEVGPFSTAVYIPWFDCAIFIGCQDRGALARSAGAWPRRSAWRMVRPMRIPIACHGARALSPRYDQRDHG